MAIKSVIQGLITNLIRTNPSLIDKTEHADVEDALLANAYGTAVTESFTASGETTPNTTPAGALRHYTFKMVKQGRKVTVSGTLTNNLGFVISNTKFLDFDAGEYLPDVAQPISFYGIAESTGASVKCSLVGSELKIVGSVGNGTTLSINFTYFTLD